MFQGTPNPGFMQETVQKGHFLKKSSQEMIDFFFVLSSYESLNPIPTGLGHVTLIYGLIPPMAGRNRVKGPEH